MHCILQPVWITPECDSVMLSNICNSKSCMPVINVVQYASERYYASRKYPSVEVV